MLVNTIWPLLMCGLTFAEIRESSAAITIKKSDSIPLPDHQHEGSTPLQTLNEEKTALPVAVRPRGRGLTPAMEILDPKRQPKPKRPLGNDIGTARGLDTSVPIATNYTTESDEESAVVSRELHDIMDAVPTLPSINIPHLHFQRDPEEEAINQRITEVARQLAESAIRKEYEQAKLAKAQKIQAEKQVLNNTKDEVKKEPVTLEKTAKTGKSYVVSNTLPLVSHIPHEVAQLQLLPEIQQYPHLMVHEGFLPRTPAPELIGPLLGGPPLKPDEGEQERTAKSIEMGQSTQYMTMPLQMFFKLMSPKYGFQPNQVVVSVPAGYMVPPINLKTTQVSA